LPSLPRSSSRAVSAVSTFAARLGVDRALAYSVFGRTWSVVAGPVTLLFVGRYLTREQQGFYYTFWSVLGLWAFFDLGLSIVLVQFASHERATLTLVDGRMTGDERARERLASLLRLATRWYGVAALAGVTAILPAGMIFFNRYGASAVHVAWRLPWVLVTVTATLNLLIAPLVAILEGSGLFQDMALMRLLQAMAANAALWIALLSGSGLYAAVVLNGTMGVFGGAWLLTRHRRLFADILSIRVAENGIRWREEIWPFQWRFAVSWMLGYLMFQIFNPIVFATAGPVVAGQMGMSLMIVTAITMFAQTWMTTRAVDFGALVASRSFERLDRVFRQTVLQSTGAMVFVALVFIGALEILRRLHNPLATRVLPRLPLLLLVVAMLMAHLVNCMATYLRAFKREAFLGIFIPMAAVTAAGSLLVARAYSVLGMMITLAASVLVIGIGAGSVVFARRRHEWLAAAASGERAP
jgi:hypothetical protein